MATACGSKADRFLRERLEMDIVETKKILEKYPRHASPVSPATTIRQSISSWKLDKDEEMKLLMEIGNEPPVDLSESRIIVIENSKVKFIKGKNKWDGCRVKKSKFSDPIKDIPREFRFYD